MDATQLRDSFLRFVGRERYVKFVQAMNGLKTKSRLRYWQEDLWSEFIIHNKLVPRPTEEVVEFFNICYAHNIRLSPPSNASLLPPIRSTPEYERAEIDLFPYAANKKFYCDECRESRANWIEQNAELCRILRRQTTYKEYCIRFLAEIADEPYVQDKIKNRSNEIAALMEPGDELWERDAGGWHRLAGSSEVAIVRDGHIIKQWCEFRS